MNGNSPIQQPWGRNHSEVSGEDSKDSPRSPYTELHSKSSLARIAELPGGMAAKELDTSEITPKPSRTELGTDMAKQPLGLGVDTQAEPRNSTEKS